MGRKGRQKNSYIITVAKGFSHLLLSLSLLCVCVEWQRQRKYSSAPTNSQTYFASMQPNPPGNDICGLKLHKLNRYDVYCLTISKDRWKEPTSLCANNKSLINLAGFVLFFALYLFY